MTAWKEWNFHVIPTSSIKSLQKATERRGMSMSDKIYAVPAAWKKKAHVDDATYQIMYADSVKNPNKFWAKQAKRIDWFKAPTKIKNTSFAYPKVSIKWFEDGITNVSVNCIDRHLKKRADQTALLIYPPRIKAPCHSSDQCAFATKSPPETLRPLPEGQINGGGSSRRFGTSPGVAKIGELLLPASTT